MNKLYKYRPLSEFLFKELLYQELYFASYNELNDPLDLSARIEFTVEKEEQIEYLIWILFKTTLSISETEIPVSEKINNSNLIEFNKNDVARISLRKNIFNKLTQLKTEHSFIWLDQIENVIADAVKEEQITFNVNFLNFKNELQRLTKKFLENSYTTCFSATNKDFLMWSHYASKHSGICLEFTLEHSAQFPYLMKGRRKADHDNYLQRISNWQIDEKIFWDRIREVNYQDEQPFINFFDFSPVFDNEHDCDLIGLSKSWTHRFAQELEWVFSTKTKPWNYEKEWRAIEINFGEPQHPEERIRHYPIEVLSSIYFGIRTPENTKKRIHNIFKKLRKEIQFYDCKPTNGRDLDFEIWEYYDD
ncbi:MAG: DUF2971 domain-containing protein [Bacteroidia bacterium]